MQSVAFLALATLAAAAPSPRSQLGDVPYSDNVLPLVSKVPRSPLKQQALESLCGHHYKGQGSGQEVGMDAPFGGSQYTINITVAGESYNLIFDTGRWVLQVNQVLTSSSDLWVASSNFTCLEAYNPMILANYTQEPQAYCMFGPTLFNASDIDQLTPVNFTNNFNISYGVPGYSDLQFAVGSSYIGGVTVGDLTVPNAHINIVESAEFFGNNVSDGLIGFAGMGLTSLFATADPSNDNATNFSPYLPWFAQAAEDNLVAPYFSIALNRPTFDQQEGTEVIPDLGVLVLGGLPKDVGLTGKHVTVDNIQGTELINGQNETVPLWWTTSVDEWKFPGSNALNTTTDLIILDSGTFNIYAPNDVAAAYAAAFEPAGVFNSSAGGYVVPCSAHIPDLSIKIGGVSFPMDKKDLIFPIDATGETCVSSVTQGGNSTSDVYILGDKFLNSVVAAFNVDTNKISIYERVKY